MSTTHGCLAVIQIVIMGPPDHHNLNARFAQNVRTIRDQNGLSQVQLAQRMSEYGYRWPQNTIQRIEHNQRRVDIAEADALARALGVSVGTLLAEPSDASKTGQIRHILNELHAAELDLQKAKQRHTQIRSQLAELNPATIGDEDLRAAALRALHHGG